eukprot:8488283-Pyramimonas_sp.AAC.1
MGCGICNGMRGALPRETAAAGLEARRAPLRLGEPGRARSSPTESEGTPSLRMALPCQVCFHHASSSSEVPLSLPERASVDSSPAGPAGCNSACQTTSVSSSTTAFPHQGRLQDEGYCTVGGS